MNKEAFYKKLEENNIQLTEYQKEQFKIYCEYLLDYNKHTNLTAIKDEEGVYLKHFYDSASVAFIYDLKEEKILDIGTGAGFPGVVLKILFPQINLTLIDSNNKKTTFLKKLLEKINISDVKVLNDRVENIKDKESFDIVISRAVSELRILAELSLPYLIIGGKVIALKSHIDEEIQKAKDTIEILGGSNAKIIDLNISNMLGKRCLVEIIKEKNTPEIYPRVYDKILKYPLKKITK